MDRRMRALQVVQKMHDFALKEKAAELSELQGRLSLIELARADLERKRIHEAGSEMVEVQEYIPIFLNHLRQQDGKLAEVETLLETHITRTREVVLAHFRAKRSFEGLEGLLSERAAKETSDREARDLDERNVLGFARKASAKS